MYTGRAEMAGCQKHYRMKSGVYFVNVTPAFFETHLNGILSTIQPTLCDACLRELAEATQEERHSLATATQESSRQAEHERSRPPADAATP
jgi:hypothetical protein